MEMIDSNTLLCLLTTLERLRFSEHAQELLEAANSISTAHRKQQWIQNFQTMLEYDSLIKFVLQFEDKA